MFHLAGLLCRIVMQFTMEATLTGFEPTFEISLVSAITAQNYGNQHVKCPI
jgi:hypothetical protein